MVTKFGGRIKINAHWTNRSMARNVFINGFRTVNGALAATHRNECGNMQANIIAIVTGVITLVIGMVLATTVNTQAATLGSAANIGSFTGTQNIGDLIPLVYISAILMLGVGLIGLGGYGTYKGMKGGF